MKISLLHPSRGRSEQAFETALKWLKNMKTHYFEYIISVDISDPQLEKYKELFTGFCDINISDNQNVVDATNEAAWRSSGDILVLVSDDFECYEGWDKDIISVFSKINHGAVLKTFDGSQKWIVTLPIMNRKYFLEQEYFYYPEYKHMFCDTDMTHKADIEGKLIFRNDLLFRHAHYSTGLNKKDEINSKADSTCNQGEALYLERVKNNLGLSPNEIVRGISAEGKQHENWLKQKLK